MFQLLFDILKFTFSQRLQQIPITLSRPILVEANTFRQKKVVFTGLAKGTNLYLSRQYIGDVHTVEGVYKCHRWRPNKTAFQMGFINTSDQDITLLPSLQGLHASACGEQKVTYPLPPEQQQPAGSINQLDHNQELSTTRQTEINSELCIHENKYLKDHPWVKSQLTCMIHKYADVFTPKSEGKVGVTDLL